MKQTLIILVFFFTNPLQAQINNEKDFVKVIDTLIAFPLVSDSIQLNIHYIIQESYNKQITINSLFVSDSNNIRIQAIIDTTDFINKPYARPAKYLTTIDVNFDGFNDFRIVNVIFGSNPDISFKYYLYNPEQKKFVYSKVFSELCCRMSINQKLKEIYLEDYDWREEKWTKWTYKVIDNKPVLSAIRIEYVYTEDDKQKFRTIIKKLINGKMKVVKDSVVWKGM